MTVRLKAYNSYCVDTVWLGEEEPGLSRWLEDRNISLAGFESLLRGQSQPRLHLPLVGQQEYSGQVEVGDLLQDQTGAVTQIKIRSESGSVVVADRKCLFVFGHWMGRADLAYIMMSGEFDIKHRIWYCSIVLLSVPAMTITTQQMDELTGAL